MSVLENAEAPLSSSPPRRATDATIPQLIGEVYEAAPPSERCRMLEHLMRPLGVLSLVVVANGVFAKIWFRRGWSDLQIGLDDTQMVRAGDVMALVDHAQQVCSEAIDGLAQMIAVSPALAGSAAAALLVAAVLTRARSRCAGAVEADDASGAGPA